MRAHANHQLRHWRYVGLLPELPFSDCGTFLYLEMCHGRAVSWCKKLDLIDTSAVPPRYIRSRWSSDNFLIDLFNSNNSSSGLELIKFDDNGFWKGTGPVVWLEDIASYSSDLADADRFLLLGANDQERMRMLIAPHDGRTPVIKTLSLTFAEARSRLEKKWQRLYVESKDQELGNAIETGND